MEKLQKKNVHTRGVNGQKEDFKKKKSFKRRKKSVFDKILNIIKNIFLGLFGCKKKTECEKKRVFNKGHDERRGDDRKGKFSPRQISKEKFKSEDQDSKKKVNFYTQNQR